MTPTTTFLEKAEHHAAQDMLLTGTYGRMNGQFRGCSIGCFLHDYEPNLRDDADIHIHKRLSRHTGIAEWALHVQDYLFERLPDPELWHVDCARAYDAFTGDWDVAMHKFMSRVQREIVANPTELNERVAVLHDRAAAGNMPTETEWSAVARAARSSERSAARAAVEDAARSANQAAAEPVAWSAAWSAARSAARSAAWAATSSAAYAAYAAAVSAVKDIFLSVLAGETTR